MEAMRGDIVRGIIELITNSDDAYASLDEVGSGRVPAKIIVEVEHRRNQPWKVVVRDRATGISNDRMRNGLTKIGGRTSGFESGEEKRGNLGRGAKDLVAFGDVTFSSIRDGRYSQLVLHADGKWELDSRGATEEDRKEQGIPKGNGTVVSVRVQPTIRCPQHEKLKQRLATHFQLRDILSDPMRRVELVNLNDETRDRLVYEYPQLPVAFQGDLHIAGYPDAKAHMAIWRHPNRYDDGPHDASRPIGILIKGNRAIYDNTLFGLEGNIHAGWFSGKLICAHIDRLAREYDDRLEAGQPQQPTNPVPIISRRREGLNPTHPFVRALTEAAEAQLRELVTQEEERARISIETIESKDTRDALDRLGREIARLVSDELREIEAEDLPEAPPILTIIPEEGYAYMGEDRTLTIAARNQGISVGEEVLLEADPGGVVEVLTPTVKLKAHARREDILVGQIRLRPLLEGEQTLITAKMNFHSAVAVIEVRSSRTVVEEQIVPPETLEFARPAYRIGWQKKKDLGLQAPADAVATFGARVNLSSSVPGVVVRTPTAQLELDDTVEFYRAHAQVEGRTLNSRAVITATLGDLQAVTHVTVTRKEEGIVFKVKLAPEDWGAFRGIIEPERDETGDEVKVVKIAARHPAIAPYLGESFEGQNAPVTRALMAEIVADVTARYVVSELYRLRRSIEVFDADRLYREHYRRITKFLPRFQKILIGEPEVARIAGALPAVSMLEVATQ
jgi:hypothetical protein